MFGIPLELLALGLLVIANGLLAMAETAVVSARKSVLEREAQEGDLAAAAVLDLTRHPTLFLGLVQFWLTLSGMIAGVLAGTRFAEPVASRLSTVDWLAPWSHLLALIFVTFGLTVFLLLFGELIPKRIGLAHPEKVAKQLAGTMRSLSLLAAPLLWVF